MPMAKTAARTAVVADGKTIALRTRINLPDDKNARCKVSRAWIRGAAALLPHVEKLKK
jgi:hypothetical protein